MILDFRSNPQSRIKNHESRIEKRADGSGARWACRVGSCLDRDCREPGLWTLGPSGVPLLELDVELGEPSVAAPSRRDGRRVAGALLRRLLACAHCVVGVIDRALWLEDPSGRR